MKTRYRLIAAALAALLATACSGLFTSDQPPRQDYLLVPLAPSGKSAPEGAPEITIAVNAVPGLDTSRILALESDARLNHYANARWPDNLPEVLTSLLQRSLEGSGLFTRVGAPLTAGDTYGAVFLEVRQFYGLRDSTGSTGSVRVELAGSVRCGANSLPLRLESSQGVAQERLSQVVAAHQAGLDDVTRQLIAALESACG